jgi:hypothetical protein
MIWLFRAEIGDGAVLGIQGKAGEQPGEQMTFENSKT